MDQGLDLREALTEARQDDTPPVSARAPMTGTTVQEATRRPFLPHAGAPEIYIIHENAEWLAPLQNAFDQAGLPFQDWNLARGAIDLGAPPPKGIFYNRMSASSHTRGHRFSPEFTGSVLAWLESHGRRVINGGRALQLEISKAGQYAALQGDGIPVPRTVVATDPGDVVAIAASHFLDRPFVLKPNRGGKGLGVQKFDDLRALQEYLEGPSYEAPIDGLHILQEYIAAPEPFITRMEFVGGRFYYAVRVDTRSGFELCPAEVCALPGDDTSQFQIIEDFSHPLVPKLERFLAHNRMHVAGVEFIVDADGNPFVYDINTNTNYNPNAEGRSSGYSGMRQLSTFLTHVLHDEYPQAAAH